MTMIKKVTVKYLKKFAEQTFALSDHIVLAGPNNSGKSTLLQAVMVWNLAMHQWLDKRGAESKAKHRTGVPVTRKDFSALPLREMNLLWTDTVTGLKKEEREPGQKPGAPRVLEITVEGQERDAAWASSFEIRYQSTEQVSVKPSDEEVGVPMQARDLNVVHVPPFSGIGAEETRYDQPFQDLLIGQGKAGDILRNLVLTVYRNSKEDNGDAGWDSLCGHVRDIFGYTLLPPEYEGKPYILCEFLPGIPRKGHGKDGFPTLDIASAGSGFHQVLLLLAFFYARPSSVLLLDEPDAHLHVILQKQIYDQLRSIAAERRCQLIIATHSEVLIDGTSPDQILSFYREPHLLIHDTERDQVREAIKRLPAVDLMLADQSPAVLYLEGESDFNLLRAWARALDHPTGEWFQKQPFWHANQGRNPAEAKGHFFAIRAIRPDLVGMLLLDGDNRGLPDRELGADGLVIERWARYEAENYLINPNALLRFVQQRVGPLFADAAEKHLKDEVPPAAYRDPLSDHDYLTNTPAAKSLLPGFFAAATDRLRKPEYYLIAEQMRPDEVHPEVRTKLDSIAAAFGLSEGQ
jgi:predicted ATPase